MVRRAYAVSLLLVATAFFLIGQIDWTKQIKNIPSYVTNALGDPGSAGIVKRTTANTSTVAGATDVWPGTVPYSSVTSPPSFVTGGGTTVSGYIPTWNNTTGTLLQPGISPTGAWPGTIPYASVTGAPAAGLADPGANGVVKRTAANVTAVAGGADLPVMTASGASGHGGAVPSPGTTAGTTHYLREDATWATVSGGGVSTQSGNMSTQNGGSAFRSLGGLYQNTTGKPMFVTASCFIPSSTSGCQAKTDATSNPTTVVQVVYAGTNTWMEISFWVLPNNWYSVQAYGGGTAATIEWWSEAY